MLNRYQMCCLLLGLMTTVSAHATETSIWKRLKQGGYVILMRHAPVDSMTHSTSPNADFENCVGQQNLSPEGQKEAARIGRSFKKHKIKVSAVLASPYCRTQDTGRLAFGKVQAWDALDLQTSLPEDEATKRSELVAARIGEFKGPGNLVLISHQPNIDTLTLELVGLGTILVLQPSGGSNFDVVERIPLGKLPK